MVDHHAASTATTTAETQNASEPAGKRQRLSPQQRIARLQAQLAQERTRLHKRSRQQDTREKIVIGGAVIKAMRENEAFRAQLLPILEANVVRDIDREAIASWLSPTSTSR